VVQVLGHPRLLRGEGCPEELAAEVLVLESNDGDTFNVEAESACMSRIILADVKAGVTGTISLPIAGKVLSKVVEYLKNHKGVIPEELQVPMPSEDLVECGASKWDAAFVKVEKDMLFDLMVAASLLSIPSLMLLTAAKAAALVKDKESSGIRKLIGVKSDMDEEEEFDLNAKYLEDRKSNGYPNPEHQPIQGVAAILHGLATAAEKSGVLSMDGKTPAGGTNNDRSSWSHINWRAAILQDWRRLEEAPEELKEDRELMFAAVSMSSGRAVKSASTVLREDAQLFLHVVSLDPSLLSEASRTLLADRDFMLQAIMINGEALDCATEDLRGDWGLVLQAAQKGRGSALKGAKASLQGDRDFVLRCAKEDPQAFRFAAEDLRRNKAVVLQAVKANGMILQYVPKEFKADVDVVAAAVAQNDQAAVFAHTSRRVDLGLSLDHDTSKKHKDKVDEDFEFGKRPKEFVPLGKRMTAGFVRARGERDGLVMNQNLQKISQFSAMNTMAANMGQFNYIASNSFLDKLPFYERPTLDSFTLMWGPVGAIGMRVKAFASADMLQYAPENLMSVLDATKILHQVLTKMDPPEWFNPCFFDQAGRDGFLTPTAGVVKGENYLPPFLPQGGAPQRKETTEFEGEEKVSKDGGGPRGEILPGPLGGWPRLAPPQDYPPEENPAHEPEPELEEGARVRLTGLPSQNGLMGTVLKCHADGRWKVALDNKMGKALLKAEFLRVIEAAPVFAGVPSAEAAAPSAPEALEAAMGAEAEPAVIDEVEPTEARPEEQAAAAAADSMPVAPAPEVEACPLGVAVEEAAAGAEAAEPALGAKAAAAERRRREIEEKRAAMKAKTEERKAALKAVAEARRQAKGAGH